MLLAVPGAVVEVTVSRIDAVRRPVTAHRTPCRQSRYAIAMALQPPPTTTVVDHIVDELRRAIYERRLMPGARLIERQLATDLGVSHIPVREALARLTEEGLLERLPRRGCRVATVTTKDLDEFASIRELLEGFVAVRVQRELTPEREAELRAYTDQMTAAAAAGDTAEVLRLDEGFHELLLSLAEHKLLTELASQLRSRLNGFMYAATRSLEGAELVAHARTHVELLDAIASRRVGRARAETSKHVQTAMDRIRRTLDAPEPDQSGVPS
jgi:DNA-binding GntR family transcriptional regulator